MICSGTLGSDSDVVARQWCDRAAGALLQWLGRPPDLFHSCCALFTSFRRMPYPP